MSTGEGPLWKLSQQAHGDSKLWFPNQADDLVHHALALCGEAGEFANLVKKLQRGDLNLKDADTRFQVMMELTDVQTYVLSAAGLMGLDLDMSLEHVRAQNMKRFGTGGTK
jgi:NTP pyrophosphatase (non-canonical NTP hydrolase)